jgi:hypothetical protein
MQMIADLGLSDLIVWLLAVVVVWFGVVYLVQRWTTRS